MCDFLNGLFDLNGDGQTDLTEQSIGFSVLDKLEREEVGRRQAERSLLFADADDEDDPS